MSDLPERVRKVLDGDEFKSIRADVPLMHEAFKDSPEILAQIDAVMAGFEELEEALAEWEPDE